MPAETPHRRHSTRVVLDMVRRAYRPNVVATADPCVAAAGDDPATAVQLSMGYTGHAEIVDYPVGARPEQADGSSQLRHGSFRRVLCDAIGRGVDAGAMPADVEHLSHVVRAVSIDNAKAHYGFPSP